MSDSDLSSDLEPWDYDFTDRILNVGGSRRLLIEKQLIEVFEHRMGQRQVLTLARDVNSQEALMLKIRYEWVISRPVSHILLFVLTLLPRLNPKKGSKLKIQSRTERSWETILAMKLKRLC
jgi:hypothetical protein